MRKRKCELSETNELGREEGGPDTSNTGQFTGSVNEMKNDSREFKSMLWRKKNLQLHVNEVLFRGEKELPAEVKALKTPFESFHYFVTYDELRIADISLGRYGIVVCDGYAKKIKGSSSGNIDSAA